jgi:hypothetical protein
VKHEIHIVYDVADIQIAHVVVGKPQVTPRGREGFSVLLIG